MKKVIQMKSRRLNRVKAGDRKNRRGSKIELDRKMKSEIYRQMKNCRKKQIWLNYGSQINS